MSMVLKFKNPDGSVEVVDLQDRYVTLGRGTESDILLQDEKVSRIHCGIRFEDGFYTVRDLKSKNGTYVNGELIDSVRLAPGDRIRVGSTLVTFDSRSATGPNTAIREVQEKMEEGKGFGTILREIVSDADEAPARPAMNPPRRKPK